MNFSLVKIIETVKKRMTPYWNDPVWSKVIAGLILTIAGIILTTLWSLINGIPFIEIFSILNNFLSGSLQIKNWILILVIFIIIVFGSKTIIKILSKISWSPVKTNNKLIAEEPELDFITESSAVFFHNRISQAFPGIRNLCWFNDPKEATNRLEILLKQPLDFQSESSEFVTDPIWWFRGDSALFIRHFKKLRKNKVLMDIQELNIKRIAVYHGDPYYKDFVYIETKGEKQTGIYKFTSSNIEEQIKKFGYSYEEFGIFNKKYIKREDYDDGATVIKNKVIEMPNAELMCRYLSEYNFIIAAKESPYNSKEFDIIFKNYLNGILQKKIEPYELLKIMMSVPKFEKRPIRFN